MVICKYINFKCARISRLLEVIVEKFDNSCDSFKHQVITKRKINHPILQILVIFDDNHLYACVVVIFYVTKKLLHKQSKNTLNFNFK